MKRGRGNFFLRKIKYNVFVPFYMKLFDVSEDLKHL